MHLYVFNARFTCLMHVSLCFRQIFALLFISKFCTNLLHRFFAPFAPFVAAELDVSLSIYSIVLAAGDAGGLLLLFTVRSSKLSLGLIFLLFVLLQVPCMKRISSHS